MPLQGGYECAESANGCHVEGDAQQWLIHRTHLAQVFAGSNHHKNAHEHVQCGQR